MIDESLWSLYLIETKQGHLYCGVSSDVERRYREHEQQGSRCARYLRGKAPLRLRFHIEIGTKSMALAAEYRVKRWSSRKKWQIIEQKWSVDKIIVACGLDTNPHIN